MFRSARWFTPNGYSVEYEWDEAAGRRSMDEAIRLMERAEQHPCGWLFGVMSPSQVDTCTPALLEASLSAARQRRWPITIHAAQSLVEFQEMTRRHGVTPIQWLHRLDFLTPQTTVAHCPNVFVRGGMLLESFGRYRDAGVNIGIGTDTDTYPHNMLDEIRWAATLSRVADRHVHSALTAEVLHAATVGGANALGRDDIGRVASGAKADLVLVDLERPAMQPCRDPLRSLVYSGPGWGRAGCLRGRETGRRERKGVDPRLRKRLSGNYRRPGPSHGARAGAGLGKAVHGRDLAAKSPV
jgi:cytosine/adenosine deaminase-related metal-dependent hydrolase